MSKVSSLERSLHVSRRAVLAGLASVAALLPLAFAAGEARAQTWPKMSFRVTMTVSPSEPLGLGVQHFINRLKEETGGNVTAQFFPSGQLGQDLDVFEQLSEGTVHLHASGFGASAEFNSFYAPWLFRDFAHVQRVLDSDLAATWNRNLIEKNGVQVLMAYPRAPRMISSNGQSVRGPEDLKGLKMRVPEIPILFNGMQKLGVEPIALNFGEVYTALQTGTIQGQENPLPTIAGFSLQEVQDYISLTEHSYAPEYIYVNVAWWEGLDPALRELMHGLLQEGQKVAGEATAKVQEELLADFRAGGQVEIVETDIRAMREAARPVLDEIGPQYLGEATYKTIIELAE